MDGKLFLGTAKFLINNGSDEAAYRSAASRAYYACFLVVRQTAFQYCNKNVRIRDGIKTEKSVRHEPLTRYLKDSSNDSIRVLGEELASLLRTRQKADYVMDSSFEFDDAEDAVEKAGVLLKDIAQANPVDIGKSMENYISKTCRVT